MIPLLLLAAQLATIRVAWDAPQAGQTWREVRVYHLLADGTRRLLATSPAPAVTATFELSPGEYRIAARSWDGTWESDDSNVVTLPAPPAAPSIRLTVEIRVAAAGVTDTEIFAALDAARTGDSSYADALVSAMLSNARAHSPAQLRYLLAQLEAK